jgi:CubicO group peptidase (beta-lactamase class C family)
MCNTDHFSGSTVFSSNCKSIKIENTTFVGFLKSGRGTIFAARKLKSIVKYSNIMKVTLKTISLFTIIFLAFQPCHSQQPEQVINRVLDNLKVIDDWKTMPRQTGESSTLAKRMEFYKTPGVTVAVINNNRVEWAKGFGYLTAGGPTPVDEKSIFQTGSVSKFVTAIVTLHFIEKGLLDLDTDVNRFLKSWKVTDNEYTKNKKVTLRFLLSHQAGIPNVNLINSEDGMLAPTLVQILNGEKPALNPAAVPIFEPGSQWSYSNIGYIIIQLILEDVVGKPFPQIADEVLFKPLKMRSSSFSYPLKMKDQKREAMPHGTDGLVRTPSMDGVAVTPGGLTTTPGDLAILTIEVMKAYQGKSEKVISQETAKQFVTKQIEVPMEAFGIPMSNGLGAFILNSTEEVSFVHPGHAYPGSTFAVIAFPALGKGAIIGVNGNIGDRLYLEILASLAIEYHWPAGEFFKQ